MKRLSILLTLALLIASCGSDSATTEDPSDTTTTAPSGQEDGIILEISDEGGFVPVEFALLQTPRFTVFSDRSVVAPTGEQFGFPGPAYPELARFELGDQEFSDLLTFIDDLAIADTDNLDINDAPNVADASTTVIRYWDEIGEHRLSIYALGISEADARSAIIQSMSGLLDRAKQATDAETYEAERVVVFAKVAEGFDRAQVTSGGAWPLSITPSEMDADVAGYFCTTLSGDDAATAAAALVGANSMTLWELDGAEYQILARPLLPHQEGC